MTKIDLKLLFNGLQSQMIAQLSTSRDFIEHPGSKGDALENAWIEWLKKYLPNRYSVDKAIVIDCKGNTSHQIDIVIYDNWFTPFIFSQNGFHYIPAEGVYAVFEVKPDLKGNVESQSYIDYAAEKIESVRKLKRTSTSIINSGNKVNPRSLTKIVGGILTNTNSFKKKETIEKHLKRNNGFKSIDLSCVADEFSFYVDYNGVENLEEENFDKRYTDFYTSRNFNSVKYSNKDNSLISFFLQLTRYLQQAIGTIAAIDLNEYSKSIDFTIDNEL